MIIRLVLMGSRTYDDYEHFAATCDAYVTCYDEVEVITTGSEGAPALGLRWAREKKHYVVLVPKATNSQILEYARSSPGRCGMLVLWNGKKGRTDGLIRMALALGVSFQTLRFTKPKEPDSTVFLRES